MRDESRIDRLTIAGCLRLAQTCIVDAHILREHGSRNASYMAEQALEQIVKALATSEGIHIQRSDAHQLDKVLRSFPDDNSEKEALAKLVWLEAYATTFRYVQPSGRIPVAPDDKRLEQGIRDLNAALARLCAHFGVDLEAEPTEPARISQPPRK